MCVLLREYLSHCFIPQHQEESLLCNRDSLNVWLMTSEYNKCAELLGYWNISIREPRFQLFVCLYSFPPHSTRSGLSLQQSWRQHFSEIGVMLNWFCVMILYWWSKMLTLAEFKELRTSMPVAHMCMTESYICGQRETFLSRGRMQRFSALPAGQSSDAPHPHLHLLQPMLLRTRPFLLHSPGCISAKTWCRFHTQE